MLIVSGHHTIKVCLKSMLPPNLSHQKSYLTYKKTTSRNQRTDSREKMKKADQPKNKVRTEEEIAEAKAQPYKSYVRGVEIDFSAENIKQILRIRDHNPGAESNFDKRQREDQRLDEVIREICVPGARWKMSSSQPDQPIQLKR
ncbi:hypothetical protein PIB30_084782 [Stylosanthes scabra]|uniref:Uncharacterized protein n=1 Tax=Stylosanthes scabra TaxID=79078 RepID=A0ABU6QV02_9FABA|nr:hypothetical protein [Stylosanthes scabra]